ncbi:MAG: DoxX family membrane protein, partial [Dehalococcoidia bacterium]
IGNPKLTFFSRLLLGFTFLVFGASKLPELGNFSDTVLSYKVLPVNLAETYAVVLPWSEVIIGSLLILGLGLRFVAPAAILVIASLIAGTAGSLYVLGTEGPCGCMPGLNWELGTSHIIAQVAMLIMAAQIWLHKGEFCSLDKRLFGRE